jgi:predicted AAA+ superfamily ATPase
MVFDRIRKLISREQNLTWDKPHYIIKYLKAVGHLAALEEIEKIPCAPFAHSTLLNLFNQYVITGGMPEVVAGYLKNKSLTELPPIYESIWETYRNDVG